MALEYNSNTGYLMAATFGRNIWITIVGPTRRDELWKDDSESEPMTLTIQDGLLLMNITNAAECTPLVPVSDTKAYKAGLSRDLGSAVQVVNESGEEQIQCLSYRYRRA